MVPTMGSKLGKKILLNTSADAVPKTKRSYHSTVVPMTLARAILRIFARSSRAAAGEVVSTD